MTLLSDLRKRALDETTEHAADWLDKAIEQGHKILPDGESPFRTMGLQALAQLEEHKAGLAKLGPQGLQAVLTLVATERYDEAALIFLRESATWDQAFTASKEAQDATAQAKRDREEAKRQAIKILKAIGSALARVALPLLAQVI